MNEPQQPHETDTEDPARWHGKITGHGKRLWRAHWHLVVAWIGVAALLIVVGSQLLPSRAPEQAPTAKASYAIMVGIAGLRWDDVDETRTPALWKLTKTGAVGSLSTQSAAKVTCPLDGWLTVSAGARAAGDVTLDNEQCPPVSPTAVEPDGDGGDATVTNQESIANDNRSQYEGAEVGALPVAVRCSSASGPGAGHAVASSTGRIDNYLPELPEKPTDLGGFLSRCALSVVDLGLLPDDDESRRVALAEFDAALASIDQARPDGSLLLVAGLADTSAIAHLHVVIAAGGGFDGGWLTSAGAGREGYLRLVDLAPTLVAALDRPLPRPFAGAPAGILDDRHGDTAVTVAEMADVDTEAAAQQDAIKRFLLLLTIAIGVLFVIAAPVLHRIRRGAGPIGRKPPTIWTFRTIVAFAMALALTLPAATLVDFIPWWRADHSMLALLASTLVIVAALTTAVLLVPHRRSPMGLMITISGVGVAVVAIDVLTGGRLQFDGLAAYSALNSAGNAGLGPLGYGVFTASLLMAAGCTAQLVDRSYRPIIIALAGCVGLFIVGSPYLGDDPAGAVALVVGICLAAAISTGGWLTFARFAWASFAGFGLLVALALADATRPVSERGPLGGFVSDMFSGDSGGRIRATLESDVVTIMSSPFTLLVLAAIAFTWVVLLQPSGGLKRAFGLYPSVRAGFVGAIVASLLGGILAGNGFIPVGAAAATIMPLAVIVALRVLARAHVRDGRTESAEPEVPVSA